MKQSSDFFLFFELSHVSHPDFLEFTASILNPGQVSRGSDDSGTFILKGLNKKVLKFWDSMLEISIILKKIQNFRNQKFEENCAANSIKVNQIRWKQTPSFFISCSKIHVISCQNKNVKHPLMEEVFSLLVALRLAEVRIRQKSVSERRSRGARSSPQPSQIFSPPRGTPESKVPFFLYATLRFWRIKIISTIILQKKWDTSFLYI